MKRIACVALLFATSAGLTPRAPAAAHAQQPPAGCPRIEPLRPADAPFAAMTDFRVEGLADGERDRLRYHWAATAGAIVSGQGTPAITLDRKDALTHGTEITVVIVGLKGNCNATLTLMLPPVIACIRPLDEYGNIRFEDEQARLDNFAIELQNDPTAQGYIVAYGGRRGRAGEAQRRADRAREYLSGHRGIEVLRLVTVDGGYREDLTVALWIVPEGAQPPQASPTVDPSEVEIIPEEPGPGRPAGKPRRRN